MAFYIRGLILYFKRVFTSYICLPIVIAGKTFLICLLSLLALLSSQSVIAQQPIEWAKYQLPPVFISKGQFVKQGTADVVYRYLQERLPSYDHSEYLSAGVRIFRDFTLDKVVCSAFTNKKGRDDIMIFSNPISILPTHNLHFIKDNPKVAMVYQQSLVNGKLSLAKLLENANGLKIGINKHRSFGDKVNQLLKQYDSSIIDFNETQGTLAIFEMMEKKRIDLTIEFPFVSHFSLSSAGLDLPLTIEPMLEVPSFVNAYIACSKNKQGQLVINDINAVLNENISFPAYRDIFEKWIPQAAMQAYREGYQEFLIESGR